MQGATVSIHPRTNATCSPPRPPWQTLDGLQAVTQGVLRGMGKQPLVAAYNLLGFWGVGITTEYAATFPGGLGLPGIWIGLMAGLTAVGEPHSPFPFPSLPIIPDCDALCCGKGLRVRRRRCGATWRACKATLCHMHRALAPAAAASVGAGPPRGCFHAACYWKSHPLAVLVGIT